jgi:hypothetical protein
LLLRIGEVHPVDLGAVEESVDVLPQPEYGRSVSGVVAADALEDGITLVKGVGEHVNLGIVPGDELPVKPDRLGRLHRVNALFSLAEAI